MIWEYLEFKIICCVCNNFYNLKRYLCFQNYFFVNFINDVLQEENKKMKLKNSQVDSAIDKYIYDYFVDDEDRQGNMWEKLLKDSSSRNISPKDTEKQKFINIVVPAEKDLKNLKISSEKSSKNTVNDSKKIDKTDGILNLDELDFHPWCNITTKEAVSAIHRATTQACKHEIANVTCLMQQGMLYPKRLPRYCPLKGKCYEKNYLF